MVNVQEYMVGTKEILVISSAAMLVIATGIMARVIIKGRKPAKLVPWLIWAGVTGVTMAALLEAHATWWELLIPLSQLGSMLVIMLVTAIVLFMRGGWRKERVNKGERYALFVCIVFVGVGVYFDEPYITLWGNFAANIVGLVPLYLEGRADPAGVTRWYWIFRGLATTAATAACLVDGISAASLIPLGVSYIIVFAMLRASVAHSKPSRILRKVRSDDPHPMLTAGILFR